MKFDELVNQIKNDEKAVTERTKDVYAIEIAVVPCGANMIGRVGVLQRVMGAYDPDFFLYMSFGFTFRFGFGDRGTITSSHRGYNVQYKDGVYVVSDNVSYGTSHRLHVATFGLIDLGKLKNKQRFRELLDEARQTLAKYKDARIAASSRSDAVSITRELNDEYYKKVKFLAETAQQECGFAPVTTMEDIHRGIVKTCRSKKSKSLMMAKQEFIDCDDKLESYASGKTKFSIFVVIFLALGTILLCVLSSR